MANESNAGGKTPAHRFRWIINNQERVMGFPLPPKFHAASKTTMADANPLTLQPGANLVETKKWDALKAADPDREIDGEKVQGEINRLLSTKIPRATHRARQSEAAGLPYLVEGPTVASKTAPLDGLGEDAAINVVDELRDLRTVQALLQVEKRPNVNEALHRVRSVLETGVQGGKAA